MCDRAALQVGTVQQGSRSVHVSELTRQHQRMVAMSTIMCDSDILGMPLALSKALPKSASYSACHTHARARGARPRQTLSC